MQIYNLYFKLQNFLVIYISNFKKLNIFIVETIKIDNTNL